MDDIRDVFEMTPLQAGMLVHSLQETGQGSYLQQYWGRLAGPLDIQAFQAAWQTVIERHDMLRAQCHWEDLDRPAFAIHATAHPEWRVEDWSALDPATQLARRTAWLEADRARGFDMDALPLMRFALIRTGADAHLLIWSFHHLLLDGWSGALVVRDVLAAYAGAPLGPTPPPFRDLVDLRGTRDREAARAYWSAALDGIDAPTPLGLERPGPIGTVEHRMRLGPDLTARLDTRARRARVTLATLMEAAWAIVLSLHSGQRDVVFGTVLSGRPADLAGAERLVGLCLETVPVRIEVDPERELPAWLDAIRTSQRAREPHAHAALIDIQRWCGLSASTPLFETLLIVESYPDSIEAAVAKNGASLRLDETGLHERTNFPLTVKVLPGDDVELVLTADTARLPAETLPKLAGHLGRVLDRFAASVEVRLGKIDVMTEEERARLVTLERGPARPLPKLTAARLRSLSDAQPDAPAVEIPGGETLGRADLMRRAGSIAAALAERGIGQGDVVAVCQDRTADLVATFLAIWHCGAAYLPLDPGYPPERIAYMFEDSGAALAVVDGIGADAVGHVPTLDVAACRGVPAAPVPLDETDLAYILYTSGSTGRPKGVAITHGALANFLASMIEAPGLGPDDRLLALTTVAFDIAGLELFGPLVAGGRVVVAPAGSGMDGVALARMIDDHDITVMQSTPAGWRVLRDSGWRGRPNLRLLSGGEALDTALAADLMKLGGELWNLYGPTETTIWSAALRVAPSHLHGAKVPVGGPLANTTLTLRDPDGRAVPPGVPGELWIGGAGLSPGYLQRPEMTAERFVFRDATRYYRTGDRMRLSDDGTLDFLGRLDDQVKLRGYRIELGEIEAALETYPAVAQAVAMVRGEGAGARLVAYLRRDGPKRDPAELRRHLSCQLPAYMIPQAFVTLDAIPLTPNGKIDRKALPEPAPVRRAREASERDAVLAVIWADVLDVEQVDPDDDFFALGGHSLGALRLIGEVRRHLGVEAELRDLFEAPTPRRFSERMGRGGEMRLAAAIPDPGPPVLSPAQHRQWIMSRLDPGRPDYHLPIAVRIDGPLDAEALERALGTLSARHDVLRCRFPEDRGRATVDILAEGAVRLRHDDLGSIDEPEREAALARIAEVESAAPFDLGAAPPWRARLVRLGAEAHILYLTLHHIVADEWSFGVMLQELAAAYAGDALPPPRLQYTDFAAWQRNLPLDDQRTYWRDQLVGAPAVTALPADRDRPARRGGAGGRVTLRVGAETARALDAVARENGATLFMVLLSAYAILLYRHGDETDLVIGTPVSNRRLVEFQDLVGLFVNMLPIRVDLDAAPDFRALLDRIRGTVLAAHANQDLPFEEVLELLAISRREHHAPVVQTTFAMPDPPRAGTLEQGLEWQALPAGNGRARFDLSLEISRRGKELEGRFDFATDIFDAGTVERLARRFEHLLEGLSGGQDLSIADLPMLSDPDRRLALPAIVTRPEENLKEWLEACVSEHRHGPAPTGCFPTHLGPGVRAGAEQLQASGLLPGTLVTIEATGEGAIVPTLSALWAGGTLVSGASGKPLFDDQSVVPIEDGLAKIAPRRIGWPRAAGGMLVNGDKDHPVVLPSAFVTRLADIVENAEAVATSAHPSECAGLAALLITLKWNARLSFDGPSDGIEVTGPAGMRRIGFGPLGSGADVQGPPECPVAFLSQGGVLRPAPGIRACLLNRAGRLVPPGSVGRLSIGGAALALGYYDAPALTAEHFRANPYMDPHAPSGSEDCLIETGLHARQDMSGGLVLVAPPQAPERLAGLRPRQMGAAPHTEGEGAGTGAPRGPTEQTLARIWRDVLGQTPASRHEGFFELGGDSVLAIQVAARAAESGLLIAPSDLFRHPTLAALAAVARPAEPVPAPMRDLPRITEGELDQIADLVSFGEE